MIVPVSSPALIPLPRRARFDRFPFVCPYGRVLERQESGWFDVALWRFWPTESFPEVGIVQAATPYAAVEALMQHHRLSKVAKAAAFALDGSIRYRAFRVCVLRDPRPGPIIMRDPLTGRVNTVGGEA